MRFTLANTAIFRGVGLHSGRTVTAKVLPAMPGTKIVFERVDTALGTGRIPARYDMVSDTQLCTKLENAHGVSVGTVEHLMAALAGSGVADARVVLDGPEVPIMDGSARAFVEGFQKAGLVATGETPQAIEVLKPVEVMRDGRRAALLPSEGASGLSIRFLIDFADRAIGHQEIEIGMAGTVFAEELAECRTFGHLAEVEQLRQLGLARGGSLENAIVVDRGRVLNPTGLRRQDEFVRHKALDAIGDLALAGAPIHGVYEGERAGHEMTNLLLRALFDDPESWRLHRDAEGAMRLPARGITHRRSADRPSRVAV
ncbi:MAG: UDP-3-O-acyl-N-acetylglucosamine deacetylase [Pseudomonadota bacterium]